MQRESLKVSNDIHSRSVDVETSDGRGGSEESEMRYLVGGEGPPVVLLHGIGLDAATVSWRHLLPTLAETHRVYAPDFPGHGRSDRPNVRYTQAYFRSALDGFLDAIDVRAPSLVGISMGGGVAVDYALEEDVEKLVLTDSYGLGTDTTWRPAASVFLWLPGVYRGLWQGVGATRGSVRAHLETMTRRRPPEELVEDVYRVIQDAAVGRTVASWQRSEFRSEGFRTCYRDSLGGLDAETLFVHGVDDPLLPVSWSVDAAEQAGGRVELFDGCGHWAPRECPDRYRRLVSRFLV